MKYEYPNLYEMKGNKHIDEFDTSPKKLMSEFLTKHKKNRPFTYKKKEKKKK